MKLRTSPRLLTLCVLLALPLAACDTVTSTPIPTTAPTAAPTSTTTSVTVPTGTTQAATAAPTLAPTGTAPLPPTDSPLPQAAPATVTAEVVAPASTAATGGTATAGSQDIATPQSTLVDTATGNLAPTPADTVPTPTADTATSTGQAITALTALSMLKQKALALYPDARLAMLTESRPDQQKLLLSSSLGDPSISENTPGGLGRNWTLVAVSPSKNTAVAISMDGTQVDLMKAGTVSPDIIKQFSAANLSALDLSKLDIAALKDSDAVVQSAGDRGKGGQIGIALIAPNGLGLGPLPTPTSGGNSPQLAYELFSTDPTKQSFIFFDAQTGKVVLDSGQ